MDIWGRHKSPLGYYTNDNKIDSYGVDHSGFSLQDEIAYQAVRSNKEQQLMTQYNNQGITNYPQYTTNFWGSSADNNYGFGTSNIGSNIENRQQTMTPVPQMAAQPSPPQVQQQPETSAWNTVKQWKDNIADGMQAGAVGYTTGVTLGNFDEITGGATAALTGNPDNYKMGRDATRKLQNDLRERHPYIYGGAEFLGAMTSPMHLFKDTTKVNKALNAATDTLNASAGYAENWKDFGTNLIVNGAANTLGLKIDKIPYTRAFGNIGRKAFTQGINQGTNYLADKAKNIFYSNDE